MIKRVIGAPSPILDPKVPPMRPSRLLVLILVLLCIWIVSVSLLLLPSPVHGANAPANGQIRASGRSLSTTVTWYCKPGSSACTRGYAANQCYAPIWHCYAAAGYRVRAALGPNWRNRVVWVSYGTRRVAVRLIDLCVCGSTGLDLYASAFQRLGGLWRGRLSVRVSW